MNHSVVLVLLLLKYYSWSYLVAYLYLLKYYSWSDLVISKFASRM